MDFGILLSALLKRVEEERKLESLPGHVSVTSLIHCGKKPYLREMHPSAEEFSPDILNGYIVELAIKEAAREAYGEENVFIEKVYQHEFEGLKIIGHVDMVIRTQEGKHVGIDIKAPRKVFARRSPDREGGIYVDYEGLILDNPLYTLQAGIYRRMMEQEHGEGNVEFYLLYNTLINGRERVFAAVPVEQSVSDAVLRRVIERYRAGMPAFRNECESYCQFKRLSLCEGVELKKEEPYGNMEDVEKVIEAYAMAMAEYNAAKEKLEILEKTLKQIITDGTVEYKGQEIGWKPAVSYSFNPEKFVEFARNADPQELLKVASMLTHKPYYGKELEALGLTTGEEKLKFILPQFNRRR